MCLPPKDNINKVTGIYLIVKFINLFIINLNYIILYKLLILYKFIINLKVIFMSQMAVTSKHCSIAVSVLLFIHPNIYIYI